MVKEFNNLEEIKKYYDEQTKTFIFQEDNYLLDKVIFNFDLNINANIIVRDIEANNINAWNIIAKNIEANNIDVWDIKALDINACNFDANNINVKDIYADNITADDISASNIYANNIHTDNINALNIRALDINYYSLCFAYENIKCKSIKGRANNAKHFVLDGVLEIENEDDE